MGVLSASDCSALCRTGTHCCIAAMHAPLSSAERCRWSTSVGDGCSDAGLRIQLHAAADRVSIEAPSTLSPHWHHRAKGQSLQTIHKHRGSHWSSVRWFQGE